MVVILCKVFYQIKVISLISNYLFLIAIIEYAIKNIDIKANKGLKIFETTSTDVKQDTLCSIYKAMLFLSIKGEKRVINIIEIAPVKIFFVYFKKITSCLIKINIYLRNITSVF